MILIISYDNIDSSNDNDNDKDAIFIVVTS